MTVPHAQPRCIITDEPIATANNSRAHVIPSALGGRLKPWDILSKDGNTLLGDKIDLPLIEAFQALMSLLDGSRDRGTNRPVRMTDGSGRTLIVEFGEPLKLAQPAYTETQTPNGWKFYIDARNLKELRTLLGRVKAKVQTFDIDDAMRQAVVVRNWHDGVLRGQLQIGPGVVFPAVFVAASIFSAYHGFKPHPHLRAYVDGFDPENPVLSPDTFYSMPVQPWFAATGQVTHIVVLSADAANKRMLVCVELFNVMTIGVVLPYTGEVDRSESYAVDILTGAEVNTTIDEGVLAGVPWAATHKNGDPDLQKHVCRQIENLLSLAKARAHQADVEALAARAFGDNPDAPLTPNSLIAAVRELIDFTLHDWERPLTTVADRENGMVMFDKLCSDFEKCFRPGGEPIFRAKIAPERARLHAALAQARRAAKP